MAFTLLNRLKEKIAGTAQAVGNVINQSIPGGVGGGLERVSQGFQNPQQYNVFSQLPEISRKLQQFPDTTIQAPKLPSRAFDQAPGGSSWFNKAVPFVSSLPGEYLRGFGKTGERLFTPSGRRETVTKPGAFVSTALDLADLAPGIGLFAGGIRTVVREGGEKLLKEGGEKLLKEGGEKVAKKSSRELFEKTAKELAPEIKDIGFLKKLTIPNRVQRLKQSLPEPIFKELDNRVITPLNKLLGDSVDWGNKYKNILMDMKVAPGSKQSELIQRVGEGKLSYKNLVSQVGEKQAQVIKNQADTFRGMYDDILQFVNTRRKAVNLPEIPKRKDYFRHMSEFENISDVFESFTTGKGTREFTESIRKHQRKGNVVDAVGNFMNYLDYAQRAGFSDLVSPELRKMIKVLDKAGADPKVVGQLEGMLGDILGTTPKSGTARFLEKITEPFRTAKVVGNPGSILAQVFNLPQGIAMSNPINFAKSLKNTEAALAVNKSNYIKSISEKTPTFLVKGKLAKTINVGGGWLQDANLAAAKALWKSFYVQGKSMRVDAAKYADEMIPLVMGERRLGQMADFYKSPFGRIMAPFTLENQAAINRLIDSVGKKKSSEVIGTLIAWNISNTLIEKYAHGYRPFFDPIDAAKEMIEYWQGSDKKEQSKLKAGGRMLGELTNLIPALQASIFTVYKVGESMGLPESRSVFGTDDPTWQNVASIYWPFGEQGVAGRYVTGEKAIDYPLNIASTVTPFLNPVLRGVQATGSNVRGYAKSRSGRAMYEMPTDPLNIARSLVFGQSSTPQAREYFENEFSRPLSKEDQKKMDQMSPQAAREFLQKTQEKNIAKNQAESYKKSVSGDSFWGKLFGNKKVPSDQAIKEELFGGNDIKSVSTATEKRKIYDSLIKTLSDEALPDEYKEKALRIAGVNPVDVGYYQVAKMDQEDRIVAIQDLLNDQSIERDELLTILAFNKRTVAGKSMLGTSIFEYLYDQGLLSKDEKKLLNAIKFDEINGKFYLDRDYKPASSGLTASQRKTMINKINSIYKTNIKKPSITPMITQAPKLTQTITVTKPSGASVSRKSQDVWFNRY